MSGQSDQWREDHRERSAADQQQSDYCFKDGTLRQSDTYLGAQFRRLRTRLGAPIAIKAMAAKLARLVYRMLRYGIKYVDKGATFYQVEHRQRQIKQLKWKAASLGYNVTPIPEAA